MKHYTQMYKKCEMPIGYVCEYKTCDGMPSMLVKITQKGGYATLEWKRA